MLSTVLLSTIVVLLACCLFVLLKIRDTATTAASITSINFDEAIRNVLDQQSQEVAKIYAEELSQIEELLKDDVDLSELADNASRRALALAIKKAEDAVVLSESDLEKIRLEISAVVQRATHNMEKGLKLSIKDDKEAIAELKQTEKVAEERVEEAHKRLEKLQSAVRSQTK